MKRWIVFSLITCVLALSGRAAGQGSSIEEARRLYDRVVELNNAGRFDEAVPLAERALAIFTNALGPEHSDVALTLNGLALLYASRGEYARAEPLYQRALAIYSKLAAQNDAAAQNVGTTLNNLAELYRNRGDYARAEPLYERALPIYLKVLGAEHPSVANLLGNLGELYRSKGDFARAEPLYRRALSIYVKALGPEDPDVARMLNNLGALYHYKGDYARAEPLYLRALAIREKKLGPQHPEVAITLNNLAEIYRAQGEFARALSLGMRALSIQIKLNPEHPDVAIALNNLAGVYFLTGDYAHAEPLWVRALAIDVKTLGPEHPDVARVLNGLAGLYSAQGNYARAEPAFIRALAIEEKTLGPEHPTVATTLSNIALLYAAKGDYPRAVQFLRRGLEIQERSISLVVASGSEDQKQLYLDTLTGDTHYTVSLHVRSAPADAQAAQLALTTILRRKGRALDAMTDQIAALRQRAAPQDRQLLDQLTAARSGLATLLLSGSDRLTPEARQAESSRLKATIAQLEDQVSRRSAEFRAMVQSVTLDAVRQALPGGAALVEIVAYQPFNEKAAKATERFGPPQYVAYVLKQNAAAPQFVELGAAASIDADIGKVREALQDPERVDVKDLARALDERVMRPIRRLLGATRNIFLSPDGALNLIPFAGLVDENGKYLVESYTISYLTSGRDLLRLQIPRQSRAASLIIGNPLYDNPLLRERPTAGGAQPNNIARQAAANRSSVDFTALDYKPLPGTAEEAKALQVMLPGATLFLGSQATEAALKQVRAPRVLHIATHGFFLPDQPSNENAAQARALLHASGPQPAARRQEAENPLLRSGLVLAGVKQQQSGAGEDGVLTALEAAGLDLWGTQLVVLSACDTGLGEVRNGAGVYGLRRALVLAGSETQVMSLWSVNDEATRDLMVGFYKRLQAGEGRAEALRHVQLAMLGGKASEQSADARSAKVVKGAAPSFSHPYYWAPFIQSGSWTGMPTPAR